MAQRFIPQTRAGLPYRIAGVLFDFDGTLTRPELIDFAAIRRDVGCPPAKGLLEYFREIEDARERRRYEAVLERAEALAADQAVASEGAAELVSFLRDRAIPMAIITRNTSHMVERSLERMDGLDVGDFGAIISRDLPLEPKPRPDGVFHAAAALGVYVGDLLVIGDHSMDIEAGLAAGALTMLVSNGSEDVHVSSPADFVAKDLAHALDVIKPGLPLPAGKVPAEFLAEGLSEIIVDDSAVLIGPKIGEDAAALDVRGDEVLVLASDPITLASESLAQYSVLVNANDVATSGAAPRWLLATLMFPPGTSASQAVAHVRGIQQACSAWGISLCGGHSEITDAVTRPVIVGMMAGTAPAGWLLDKSNMSPEDRILLTKKVAVEGTGLIAREFAAELRERGLTAAEIARSAAFLEEISILQEAGMCRGRPGVSALHDVTEGGLATAVQELSAASGFRLRIDMEAIPVYPETRHICDAMGLDPLGLIGSGSLLIACDEGTAVDLAREFAAEGIPIAEIGRVLQAGKGVEAYQNGVPVEWPTFARDEVSRLSRPADRTGNE